MNREHRTLVFALDYDETFTADKFLWTLWVEHAKSRGHSVTFVTFRHGPDNQWRDDNNADITHDAMVLGIPVVYCNHKQKKHVFKADVWIDDMPELIVSYTDMVNLQEGCEVNNDLGYVPEHDGPQN